MLPIEEISKIVSHALRHEPWLYELEIDKEGWTSLHSLINSLQKIPELCNISTDDIFKVINSTDKKRYEVNNSQIRALYGHSLKDRIYKVEFKPPKILFHGTTRESFQKIAKNGLLPMKRQYIHLS